MAGSEPPRRRREIALKDISLCEIDCTLDRRRRGRSLHLLASSIREVGMISPPIVVAVGTGRWNCVSGLRGIIAARRAGLTHITCEVRPSATDGFLLRLVSNIATQTLSPLQEAEAFKRLTKSGMSINEIARKCAVAPHYVTRRIRLLDLPSEAKAALDRADISLEDAARIIRLPKAEQADAARQVLEANAAPVTPCSVDTMSADEREIAAMICRLEPTEIVAVLLSYIAGGRIRRGGDIGPGLVSLLKASPRLLAMFRREVRSSADSDGERPETVGR